MAQAVNENSTWAKAVRAAAGRGQLSHAVILTGEGDKLPTARYIAAAHLCRAEGGRPCLRCNSCRKVLEGIHPDVTEVRDADRKELSVETIRTLRQDVYIRPNEGERKVYLFADCTQLNERDQNVLLKIVEEGPPYAAFIFCADSPAALLETIRSRCVMLKYDDGAEAPLRPDAVELCRAFAAGRLLPVTAFLVGLDAKKPVPKREEVSAMLRDCWRTAAEALLLRRGKPRPEPSCAEEARRLADRLTDRQLTGLESVLRQYAGECDYNVGVGHVLGGLAAKWEELL